MVAAVADPENALEDGFRYAGSINVVRKKWEPYDPTPGEEEPEEPLERVTSKDIG